MDHNDQRIMLFGEGDDIRWRYARTGLRPATRQHTYVLFEGSDKTPIFGSDDPCEILECLHGRHLSNTLEIVHAGQSIPITCSLLNHYQVLLVPHQPRRWRCPRCHVLIRNGKEEPSPCQV